ncbi:MAG TPA: ABC transporter permease [Candidatus Angelobacter sp.]|jgi:predicted permease|nr:ABC transporter permease [Candidatus Angelobacter sp.]
METLLQDVRYGIRMLLRSPIVTLVAVLTLALGIGANTAIFSTLNGLFLRPLPVANADRLTALGGQTKGVDGVSNFSWLEYQDIRSQASGFSDVIGYNLNLVGFDADGKSDTIVVSFVSGNYFPALGLKPTAGRFISGEEIEKAGDIPEVVLGYGLWKKRFNEDRSVIGKQIKLSGKPATIVGVAPKDFHGLYSLIDMQAYLPMSMRTNWSDKQAAANFWTKRDSRQVTVLAYLKPGMSMQQVQSSLNVLTQRWAQQYPEDKDFSARVYPERLARPEPDPSNGIVIVGVLFMVLAGLVLLLACTNVANIVLVRSTARAREMAVRAALGAARTRLIRQLMTESIVLAALGGAVGLLIGAWASHLLGSIQIKALGSQLLFDFSFDWRVFAFGLTAALMTGLLVGSAPAFRVSRTNLSQVLHEGSRGVVAGSTKSRFRNALVVIQVAGSLMLLVVAGLFVRSTRNAERSYLGFDPHHVLNASFDLRSLNLNAESSQKMLRMLEQRVRELPGVESVSLAAGVPMGYRHERGKIYIEGQSSIASDKAPNIDFNRVSRDYFQTMRIPVLRGRTFTDQDNARAPLVAVVNEYMAKRYWPNQDAIGKRFSLVGESGPFIEIVGITRTGKYANPTESPSSFIYLPIEQNPEMLPTLQIRTSSDPAAMETQLEGEIRSLLPGVAIIGVETMEQTLEGANGLFLYRMGTRFSGALGMIGLILAVVGVYGVISYAAALRTHEIGVRMALGASRNTILAMVLKQGLKLVGAGVIAGLILTMVATRGITSLLVDVSPMDPLTLAVVSLLLAAVGLLASFIPARRAMNVEPLKALKYE